MIQDLAPKKFHPEYRNFQPEEDGTIVVVRGRTVLVRRDEREFLSLPKRRDFGDGLTCTYLFSIDGEEFFLGLPSEGDDLPEEALPDGYAFEDIFHFRSARPRHTAYAAVLGSQLCEWHISHRYCGHCGVETVHSSAERMLQCPKCGRTFYPHISPAVIVGVIHRGKLLMSKYAGRQYRHFALIAGFSEAGETIEETVHREVMEEVGLAVSHLRFYKSQPWPFSSSLLMGFFCELDGDDETIRLQEDELAMAGFYPAEEVPDDEEHCSLTSEMMAVFKKSGGVDHPEELFR